MKVHIHTEQPGDMLSLAQRFGSLINIKIENMREQHSAILESDRAMHEPAASPAAKSEKKEYGIVTVAMGSGIKELFTSLGAGYVIEGGQTMNPSTEDIVKAIEEVNAEKVIVLPNNGNIVMAAEQAATVADQDVAIVRSKNVPQGMAALLAFNPAVNLKENQGRMTEALNHVTSGQLTHAVRDTSIDGIEIKKGDFMGIMNGKIVASMPDQTEALHQLIKEMVDEDSEILTLITGEDATEEETKSLVQYIEETYPLLKWKFISEISLFIRILSRLSKKDVLFIIVQI